MAEKTVPVLSLWAKGAPADRDAPFHPLPCHLIDVASVAWSMWETVVPSAVRRWFAGGLGLDESVAGRWVGLWAGLHDVGKASPAFQRRMKGEAPHGTISACVLRDLLTEPPFGMATDAAEVIATVVGGHHGVFPRSGAVENVSPRAMGHGAVWAAMRRELALTLVRVLDVPPGAPRRPDNAMAMWLAGLVSVADWIGSDEGYFAFAATDRAVAIALDVDDYVRRSAAAAARALDNLGWSAWPTATAPRTFAELFPKIDRPYPVQTEVRDLADRLDGPALVIVEAPMGEGKTEAAMYLADRGNAALGRRGHYFALPTQATSNQMFGRVRAFLGERYPAELVNLLLLHGQAALSAEFAVLRQEGARLLRPERVDEDPGVDVERAGVMAGEWFTHRKRGVLAPFGVGTIDQVLLAALQTRHVFVRLFGLAQKTVIVDEAHAYDAYMSTLLERLLAWLAALDCTVVVLSATLPRGRREALVRAFAEGRGEPSPPAPLPTAGEGSTNGAAVAYPRVTWWSEGERGGVGIPAAGRKRVVIEQFRGGEVADEEADRRLGERLAAALAGGGCAAVICNTVARAQRVYRALRDGGHFAPEEIDLLHARFLYEEREAREQRALIRFGKPGGRVATADGEVEVARPERAVLVATQVIEQSLDLDFDLMVTDLAPVDLVLQRVGRLHRHARPDRPRGLTEPVVWVRWPGERDGAPTLDPGDAAVYEPHVLLRSWWVLRDRMAIVIPDDVEALIEAVYDESGASPDDGSQRFRREWEDTLEGHRAAVAEERDEAEKRWLKAPTFSGATWRLIGEPREEDAPDFHKEFQALTRLAERSVEIVCLYGTRERPTFDRSGLDRATVRGMPSLEQAKRLLRRSVRVTARGAVAALLDGEVPAGWRKSALLRNHRLVVLEDGATAFVGTYRLRLDRDTGLEIERRGTEERE